MKILDYLLSKWAMLFLMGGMFFVFLPGTAIWVIGYREIGDTMMLVYLWPTLFWAIITLAIFFYNFIKTEFK